MSHGRKQHATHGTKTHLSPEAQKRALAAATGIAESAALEALVDAGIGADTVAALGLLPLVEVAWADGRIDAGERAALLASARQAGFGDRDAGRHILEAWLEQQPSPALKQAWRAYAKALAGSLGPDTWETRRRELLERARGIAEASGGIFGRRKVTRAERIVLDELQQAVG